MCLSLAVIKLITITEMAARVATYVQAFTVSYGPPIAVDFGSTWRVLHVEEDSETVLNGVFGFAIALLDEFGQQRWRSFQFLSGTANEQLKLVLEYNDYTDTYTVIVGADTEVNLPQGGIRRVSDEVDARYEQVSELSKEEAKDILMRVFRIWSNLVHYERLTDFTLNLVD